MSAQLRLVSKMVSVAAFSLIVLLPGIKAHAQSVAITNFSATGAPGGYYDVTDTVSLGMTFSSIPYAGGYGYSIDADVMYYSGPNLTGTLLLSTTTELYDNGGPLSPGNSKISANINLNTPATLRASEPAGTQSIFYVYTLDGGGGCMGWSGSATAASLPYFVVHG
jgi:hypothetical protein